MWFKGLPSKKKNTPNSKMVNARLDWEKQHKHWTEDDWAKVIVYLFTCLSCSNFSAFSCWAFVHENSFHSKIFESCSKY